MISIEIFILTSNRVGTFDAAFKTRIQLSLRYPKLQAPGRQNIWENFLRHLVNLGQVAHSRPQVKTNSYLTLLSQVRSGGIFWSLLGRISVDGRFGMQYAQRVNLLDSSIKP